MATQSRHVRSLVAAYPHQIEVVGDEEIHFLVAEADLPSVPFTPVDPLIVARQNPLDPVEE